MRQLILVAFLALLESYDCVPQRWALDPRQEVDYPLRLSNPPLMARKRPTIAVLIDTPRFFNQKENINEGKYKCPGYLMRNEENPPERFHFVENSPIGNFGTQGRLQPVFPEPLAVRYRPSATHRYHESFPPTRYVFRRNNIGLPGTVPKGAIFHSSPTNFNRRNLIMNASPFRNRPLQSLSGTNNRFPYLFYDINQNRNVNEQKGLNYQTTNEARSFTNTLEVYDQVADQTSNNPHDGKTESYLPETQTRISEEVKFFNPYVQQPTIHISNDYTAVTALNEPLTNLNTEYDQDITSIKPQSQNSINLNDAHKSSQEAVFEIPHIDENQRQTSQTPDLKILTTAMSFQPEKNLSPASENVFSRQMMNEEAVMRSNPGTTQSTFMTNQYPPKYYANIQAQNYFDDSKSYTTRIDKSISDPEERINPIGYGVIFTTEAQRTQEDDYKSTLQISSTVDSEGMNTTPEYHFKQPGGSEKHLKQNPDFNEGSYVNNSTLKYPNSNDLRPMERKYFDIKYSEPGSDTLNENHFPLDEQTFTENEKYSPHFITEKPHCLYSTELSDGKKIVPSINFEDGLPLTTPVYENVGYRIPLKQNVSNMVKSINWGEDNLEEVKTDVRVVEEKGSILNKEDTINESRSYYKFSDGEQESITVPLSVKSVSYNTDSTISTTTADVESSNANDNQKNESYSDGHNLQKENSGNVTNELMTLKFNGEDNSDSKLSKNEGIPTNVETFTVTAGSEETLGNTLISFNDKNKLFENKKSLVGSNHTDESHIMLVAGKGHKSESDEQNNSKEINLKHVTDKTNYIDKAVTSNQAYYHTTENYLTDDPVTTNSEPTTESHIMSIKDMVTNSNLNKESSKIFTLLGTANPSESINSESYIDQEDIITSTETFVEKGNEAQIQQPMSLSSFKPNQQEENVANPDLKNRRDKDGKFSKSYKNLDKPNEITLKDESHQPRFIEHEDKDNGRGIKEDTFTNPSKPVYNSNHQLQSMQRPKVSKEPGGGCPNCRSEEGHLCLTPSGWAKEGLTADKLMDAKFFMVLGDKQVPLVISGLKDQGPPRSGTNFGPDSSERRPTKSLLSNGRR